MACFGAAAGWAVMVAAASAASRTSDEPNRNGERMMVVTVSGLYRRVVTDV
jgi:hypothetical protein